MNNHVFVTRIGRKLEVREYGDGAGHPTFFFHGLIGSHYQASYIADQARENGLRLIAPNRPGVGASEFIVRKSASRGRRRRRGNCGGPRPGRIQRDRDLGRHSLRFGNSPSSGPARPDNDRHQWYGTDAAGGRLDGMDRRRRIVLEIGSRYPRVTRQGFRKVADRFRADNDRFLARLIATWSIADQNVFRRKDIYDLFMKDLHQVFTEGRGPETLSQELTIYRNYGLSLRDLPADKRIILWHGLSDNIVPPAMAWKMTRALPNAESHFVPGGHFVAVEIADRIIARLRQSLDQPAPIKAPAGSA